MTHAYAPTPPEQLLVLAVSWTLVGLILTVHFVHYPSFRYAGAEWVEAHRFHTSAIGMVVGPMMVLELALAVWLVWRSGGEWLWVVPLVLVILTWANTFFQAVPLHNQLEAGFDRELVDRLVRVDSIRTGLWVVKAVWVSVVYLRGG